MDFGVALPRVHSQYVTQLLKFLHSLRTPAALHQNPAATTDSSPCCVGTLGPVLALPLLVHVHGERPAVELQHSLLENRSRGEEEEGPDDGEGPLLEARGPRAAQAPTTLVLPHTEPLQTTYEEEQQASVSMLLLLDSSSRFLYLPRKGSSRSNRVRKAARSTEARSLSSSSFSGCSSPHQNSGATQDDKRICRVSSSQLPRSRSRP